MFCPLCKAEFRPGFTQCSDCRIALVGSQAEAESAGTSQVWDGEDRHKCSRILDALVAAGIAVYSKEFLKKTPWSWISISLWRFMEPRPTFHIKVWVLGRDRVRAEAVLKRLEDEEKAEWDEDE